MIEEIIKKVKYLAKSVLCMGLVLGLSAFSAFTFAAYSFYRVDRMKKKEYAVYEDDEEEVLAIYSNGNV